jgi:lipopolysaccharide export system protein LptC
MASTPSSITADPARRGAPGAMPHGKARVHSRMVRLLRVVLPLVMVGIVALLVALVVAHALRRQAAAQKDASTPIRMVNPHFFGRDAQGRAFTLGAQQASRDEASFQTVLLTDPSLVMDVNGPRPSRLTADAGVYHEDTRLLYLKGHVHATNTKQSSFATDEATVNTRTGEVVGGAPLSSQSQLGNLTSSRFNVYDKGDRVVFKGGVHARLNQH